jgi:hypothetical protein
MRNLALITWIPVVGGAILARLGGQAHDIGSLIWLLGVLFQLGLGFVHIFKAKADEVRIRA